MTKLLTLAFAIASVFTALPVTHAASVGAFVVVEKNSDSLLLQDENDRFWLVEAFLCSVWVGDIVYAETDFLGAPSMFGKITKSGSYSSCSISDSEEMTHTATVQRVFDTEDTVLLTFGGRDLLVEYGYGCTSMWRTEGKKIYLYVGGSSLDGIGDKLGLQSGDTCSIWDVSTGSVGRTSTPASSYFSGTATTHVELAHEYAQGVLSIILDYMKKPTATLEGSCAVVQYAITQSEEVRAEETDPAARKVFDELITGLRSTLKNCQGGGAVTVPSLGTAKKVTTPKAKTTTKKKSVSSEDNDGCGANMHKSGTSCSCNLGYARRGGSCVFSSCPSGYKLDTAKGSCELKPGALGQKVACLKRRPCTCPAGYAPLGNRTCVPQ